MYDNPTLASIPEYDSQGESVGSADEMEHVPGSSSRDSRGSSAEYSYEPSEASAGSRRQGPSVLTGKPAKKRHVKATINCWVEKSLIKLELVQWLVKEIGQTRSTWSGGTVYLQLNLNKVEKAETAEQLKNRFKDMQQLKDTLPYPGPIFTKPTDEHTAALQYVAEWLSEAECCDNMLLPDDGSVVYILVEFCLEGFGTPIRWKDVSQSDWFEGKGLRKGST